MNKVFIVTVYLYGESKVEGVFSTKESAQRLINKFNKEEVEGHYGIEEHDIDSLNEVIERSFYKVVWQNRELFNSYGYEIEWSPDSIEESPIKVKNHFAYKLVKNKARNRMFEGIVRADNKEHAQEILQDFVSKYNDKNKLPWS